MGKFLHSVPSMVNQARVAGQSLVTRKGPGSSSRPVDTLTLIWPRSATSYVEPCGPGVPVSSTLPAPGCLQNGLVAHAAVSRLLIQFGMLCFLLHEFWV